MEMENNWKYIVYCTINTINNKIYIGVHKTLNPEKFDGYIGCGIYVTQPHTYNKAKTKFQFAVKKHGVNCFKRSIVAIFNSDFEAYSLEEEIIDRAFLERPDVYNMCLGGINIGEFQKIKVHKYSLNGDFIESFDSLKDAAKSLQVDYTYISYGLRKKVKIKDSLWSYSKADKINSSEYKTKNLSKNKVFLYSKNGDFLKVFNTQKELAIEVNISQSSVTKAIKEGSCVKKEYYISSEFFSTYDRARLAYIKKRKIYKYNSDGNFIYEYSNQLDAEKENKGSNINKSLKTGDLCKNNFYWHIEKLNNIHVKRSNKKPVGKYTLEGALVESYKSATEAARLNGTAVWHVLSGRSNTHKNHKYGYLSN